MKILMVLPFFKTGGTERQASYIVNYLKDEGHQVGTLCVENIGSFKELFQGPIYSLNSKNNVSKFFINVFLFLKFLRQKETDILISRAWNANMLCGIVSILTGKPAVLFLSGSINLSDHSALKKFIFKHVLKRSAKIIAVSKASKKNCMSWLNIPSKKIEVIHNGVDIDWINKQAKGGMVLPNEWVNRKNTIVFVGSLNHRKGLDILLKAMEKVVQEIEVNLIIVGDGELRSYYQGITKKLRIEPYIYFIGEKVNPFPYMKFGETFVLTSRAEGFPNVLLEAMALGKAVISTDCETGPREILNGNNGTLVPVDDFEQLSSKILMYINQPILKNNHERAAKETVQMNFRLKRQMQKIEKVLQLVLRD